MVEKIQSKILNLVVLYSNEEEIVDYARELEKQSVSEDIHLVIVINKIGLMGKESLINELSEVNIKTFIYNPGKNLGYLNGLIFGYNQYIKGYQPPKWIVMSNTDITFSTEKFFEVFLGGKYNKDIWLIGPSIYSLNNKSYDNPQYKNRHSLSSLNKRIFVFKRPIISYFYLKAAGIKAKKRKKRKEESQYSYSVHGCFFFVSEEFMNIIKKKQYGTLMYSEEAYLAELVRMNGKKCYYDSKIELIHTASTVTGKLKAKKISKYFLESLEYIREEFYTPEYGDKNAKKK